MPKPPKPPDENDKKRAQKGRYDPGSGLVPYEPASAVQHKATARPAAELPKVSTAGRQAKQPLWEEPPPDFSRCSWVRFHRTWPPRLRARWGVLPWRAQALYGLLLTACDRDGGFHLASMGLRAVCGFINAPLSDWPAIEPLLTELCAHEWAHHDQDAQLLSLIHYSDSQKRTDTPGAIRTRRYRERHARKTGDS